MKLWKMLKTMVAKDQIQKRIDLISTSSVDNKMRSITSEVGKLTGGVLYSTIKGLIKYSSENIDETAQFYEKHEKVYKSYCDLLEAIFETDFIKDVIEITNKQLDSIKVEVDTNQEQVNTIIEKVNILLNDENMKKASGDKLI